MFGDVEKAIRSRVRELAGARPRYGYRRLTALACTEGVSVNHTRIRRQCRDEGLRVLHRAEKGAGALASRPCWPTGCLPGIPTRSGPGFLFWPKHRHQDTEDPLRHRRVHPRGPGDQHRADAGVRCS